MRKRANNNNNNKSLSSDSNNSNQEKKLKGEEKQKLTILEIINSRHYYQLIIVFCLSVLVYLNSIHGGFVFDDVEAIVENQDILPITSWSNIWKNDFWGYPMTNEKSHKSYRPLTVATFRFTYWLSGFDTKTFHLFNILLHAINSCLIVLFVRRINFSSTTTSTSTSTSSSKNYIPFLTGIFFACHPIHTEAVASHVGRAELLSGVFFLLGLLAYQAIISKHIGTNRDMDISTKEIGLIIVTVILSFLSMISKEQGIMVIGVCLSYDILIFYFNNDFQKEVVGNGNGNGGNFFVRLFNYLVRSFIVLIRMVILLIFGILFMFFRFWIMNFSPPPFAPDMNPIAFSDSYLTKILTYSYVNAYNFYLLLFPSSLCCDWSMGSIPLINGFDDSRNIFTVIIMTLVLSLLFISVNKIPFWLKKITISSALTINERQYLIISLILLIIPFIPASNLFFTVGFVIAERVLYLPSIGFCILISLGFQKLLNVYPNKKHFTLLVIIIIIGLYCNKTITRNFDWHTEEQLFRSGIEVNPNNSKLWYNLAVHQPDDIAKQYYLKAVQIWDCYDDVYYNLANLYARNEEIELAEKTYKKLFQLNPEHVAGLMNYATLLRKLGKEVEAEKRYEDILKIDPNDRDTLINFGDLKRVRGEVDKAISLLNRAIAIDPTNSNALASLVLCKIALNQNAEARNILAVALKHDSNNPVLRQVEAHIEKLEMKKKNNNKKIKN